MATHAEVKAALVGISEMIAGAQSTRVSAKAQLLAARNQLAALPSQFSGIITTINAYTPTGAFETLAKDERAKLTADFTALKSALEAELTAIGVSFS